MTIRKFFPAALFALSSVVAAPAAAAIYCVGTTTQLDNALSAAQGNGDDEIRLLQGTYTFDQPGINLLYASETPEALTVSGGWLAGCLIYDPGAKSVLDGENLHDGLGLGGTSNSTITVQRMAFVNLSGTNGGGLRLNPYFGQEAKLVVEQNAFIGNRASGLGGALSASVLNASIAIRNNLFYGNRSGRWVVYVGVAYGDIVTLTNNTVLANLIAPGSPYSEAGVRIQGSGFSRISNNILYGNGALDLEVEAAALYRNDIGTRLVGDAAVDEGNLSFAPEFGGGLGSFVPATGSALVDAGSESVPGGVGERDVTGATRVQGPGVDIGAYESKPDLFRDGFE